MVAWFHAFNWLWSTVHRHCYQVWGHHWCNAPLPIHWYSFDQPGKDHQANTRLVGNNNDQMFHCDGRLTGIDECYITRYIQVDSEHQNHGNDCHTQWWLWKYVFAVPRADTLRAQSHHSCLPSGLAEWISKKKQLKCCDCLTINWGRHTRSSGLRVFQA